MKNAKRILICLIFCVSMFLGVSCKSYDKKEVLENLETAFEMLENGDASELDSVMWRYGWEEDDIDEDSEINSFVVSKLGALDFYELASSLKILEEGKFDLNISKSELENLIITSFDDLESIDESKLETALIDLESIKIKNDDLKNKIESYYKDGLDFKQKIEKNLSNVLSYCNFYGDFDFISKEEIISYTSELTEKPSIKQSTGGYYSDKTDRYIGPGKFDPEETWEKHNYYGDFYQHTKSIESLGVYYERRASQTREIYFKDKLIYNERVSYEISWQDADLRISMGNVKEAYSDGEYMFFLMNNSEWEICKIQQ